MTPRGYRGGHRRPRHARTRAIAGWVAYVALFVALGVVIVLLMWALAGCDPYAPAAPSEQPTPVVSNGGQP